MRKPQKKICMLGGGLDNLVYNVLHTTVNYDTTNLFEWIYWSKSIFQCITCLFTEGK